MALKHGDKYIPALMRIDALELDQKVLYTSKNELNLLWIICIEIINENRNQVHVNQLLRLLYSGELRKVGERDQQLASNL